MPVAAYQVSGEYAMVEAAAAQGWVDRQRIILETLTGIRRAGAGMVLTYWATEAAGWLGELRWSTPLADRADRRARSASALWAGVCAALDRLPPKTHLQALFALQALVLVQAAVALVRAGDWDGSKPELSATSPCRRCWCPAGWCSRSRSAPAGGRSCSPPPA